MNVLWSDDVVLPSWMLLRIGWVGVDGSRVFTSVRLPDSPVSGPALDVLSDISACSIASDQSGALLRHVTTPGNVPGPGPYQSCLDSASIAFRCADDSRFALVIPAPLAGIFLADTETVDLSHVAVAALVARVLVEGVCSDTGSPAVEALRGWRWRAPAP